MRVVKEPVQWNIEKEVADIYAIIKLIDDETPDLLYSKRDYCYTFRCPCCNIETEIKANLPIDVKRQSLEKISPSVKEIRVNKGGRMYL